MEKSIDQSQAQFEASDGIPGELVHPVSIQTQDQKLTLESKFKTSSIDEDPLGAKTQNENLFKTPRVSRNAFQTIQVGTNEETKEENVIVL